MKHYNLLLFWTEEEEHTRFSSIWTIFLFSRSLRTLCEPLFSQVESVGIILARHVAEVGQIKPKGKELKLKE